MFWFAAGRSGTGGIFATRPPVPSRHQILTCLEAWEARAENFPFTRYDTIMLSRSRAAPRWGVRSVEGSMGYTPTMDPRRLALRKSGASRTTLRSSTLDPGRVGVRCWVRSIVPSPGRRP